MICVYFTFLKLFIILNFYITSYNLELFNNYKIKDSNASKLNKTGDSSHRIGQVIISKLRQDRT